jgi:arabinogalactan endo-1,4-beta-galactosidase
MHTLLRIALVVLALASVAPAQSPATRPAFRTGVDANYTFGMERAGKAWTDAAGAKGDPLATLARAGCAAFRVRLWTNDDGPHGLREAVEIARRAQAAGLRPYVVLFLSENWSDMVKQPAPAAWQAMDLDARAAAVEQYAERAARAFADAGVRVEWYEVGNEIDFGLCGVFEEEWPKRVSLEYMSQRIWPGLAKLLAAGQRGVLKANADAKFIVHLARWNETDYNLAFWRHMRSAGARVDFAGLSYFPTSVAGEPGTLPFLAKQTARIHAELGVPVVICETAYPSEPKFAGQFADWNKPVEGYPLDPDGQRKWLAAFLGQCRADPHVAAAFYWSPEWYPEFWRPFALFDEQGKAKPALGALQAK